MAHLHETGIATKENLFDRIFQLRRFRQLPRWTIIIVGLGLAGLAIFLGLILEPAATALSPTLVQPTPTLPAILYGHGLSEGCQACHFSLDALQASAVDVEAASNYVIDPASLDTPHGRLGCLACHDGQGQAADKEKAHEGLVPDMSADDPLTCVICHRYLPSEIPGDQMRVPHGMVVERILVGEPCDVHCSDCHGAVGHGFDPLSGEVVCSMSTCVDCHAERDLEVQMTDCDACHIGPHDVAASLTCNDCHTSTTTWQQVRLGVHPVELPGKHGELACFDCHEAPNFKGLNNVCSDCHVPGHDDYGNGCTECHDPGGTWALSATTWEKHATIWTQYKGYHLEVGCDQCHGGIYAELDPGCENCHTAPLNHSDGRDQVPCVQCHQANRLWGE